MSDERKVVSAEGCEFSVTECVSESNIVNLINDRVGKLNELDLSVKKAMKSAADAKKSAKNASDISVGFFNKGEVLEGLQSAGLELSKAVQSGADAQQISFQFQTRLAEITKYLFALGVSNIASNRFVVRELELKLRGASEKELSELARQELLTVVKQLKDQEDTLKKQDDISKAIKSFDRQLAGQSQKILQFDDELRALEGISRLQEKQLAMLAVGVRECKSETNRTHMLLKEISVLKKLVSAALGLSLFSVLGVAWLLY